jgi:diaminohydroxyphosphoribosylaminopyrimidine deaminase/5-amino-6-(5-phosphoribosylamino)uracil reductase
LARTARDVPVIVAVAETSSTAERKRLEAAGCEVLVCPGGAASERLAWLLGELGRRRMTNLLVEGGGELLGSFLDAGEIDEVHVFIAPKIVGGQGAAGPMGGTGLELLANALSLAEPVFEQSGRDIYIHGRVARN